MLPHVQVMVYTAGFRGRNTWLTFEPDLVQLGRLRDRITTEMAEMGLDLPEDEWSLLLALRHYVHKRLPHDGWNAADQVDAFTLLDQANSGTAYRCVEHGLLLTQVYQAFGIPARQLGLRLAMPNLGIAMGHVLGETWLTRENRWVVMDSQMDAHWEHAGRPLGGDELQQLVLAGRAAELRWVFHPETSSTDRAEGERVAHFWAGYFARIDCGPDAAYLSHPRHTDRRGQPAVAFLPPQIVPQFQFEGGLYPNRFEPDPSVFWFPCNQVAIHVRRAELLPESKLLLELQLEHCAPWFDRFQLDATGTAQLDGDKVSWTLEEGDHYLTVQTVNAMGRLGHPATLGLLFCSEASMARSEAMTRARMQPAQ